MGREKRRASIPDVARAAGVAPTTVSRVANDDPRVRPETRGRVLAAMRALHYRPNVAARALRTGNSRNIGIVVRSVPKVGNASPIEGFVAAASDNGYTATFSALANDDPAALRHALDHLVSIGAVGLIISSDNTDFPIQVVDSLDDILDGVQIVLTGGGEVRRPISRVGTDQRTGTRLAVEHLLSLGHSTVEFVGGPRNSFSTRAREATWRELLAHRGLPQPEPFFAADWSAQAGLRAGARLIAAHPACTAVFAANDFMALGVIAALQDAGRAVPQDVSVVGFDDTLEPYVPRNRITTVHQDYMQVAVAAIRQIAAHLSDPSLPYLSVEIQPTLVVRASTAPPPSRS